MNKTQPKLSEETIDSLFYKQIKGISTKVKILCLAAIAVIVSAVYFLPAIGGLLFFPYLL